MAVQRLARLGRARVSGDGSMCWVSLNDMGNWSDYGAAAMELLDFKLSMRL